MLKSTIYSFALILATIGILTSGCATKIAIRSMQPGPVSVGATDHLVILHGEGRRSAREVVFMELVSQGRSRGYFSVEDRSEDGIVVRIAGRRVVLEGGENSLESRQAGVRVDVLEWSSFRDIEKVTKTNAEGQKIIKNVTVKRGSVLLAVTLFDPSGRAFLAETEYQGVASTRDMQMPKEELMESAAKYAVSRLFNDITPIQVTSHVVLDDKDPGQKHIIETAKAGSIAMAADDARRYLEQNPNNAAAAYNLAVFLEAMGDYGEAMSMYDRALRLGNKDFYVSARAGCARRLAGVAALNPEDETVRSDTQQGASRGPSSEKLAPFAE